MAAEYRKPAPRARRMRRVRRPSPPPTEGMARRGVRLARRRAEDDDRSGSGGASAGDQGRIRAAARELAAPSRRCRAAACPASSKALRSRRLRRRPRTRRRTGVGACARTRSRRRRCPPAPEGPCRRRWRGRRGSCSDASASSRSGCVRRMSASHRAPAQFDRSAARNVPTCHVSTVHAPRSVLVGAARPLRRFSASCRSARPASLNSCSRAALSPAARPRDALASARGPLPSRLAVTAAPRQRRLRLVRRTPAP